MRTYPQWILVRIVPRTDGKTDKFPLDHRTLQMFPKGSGWQQDPATWTTYETARFLAAQCGPGYGIGFLFTPNDKYFFLDIDDCLVRDTNGTATGWSQSALTVINHFSGALVEVSQSGEGLHIFGSYRGLPPEHSCKNKELNVDLYTEGRFALVTHDREMGSCELDCTDVLSAAVDKWWRPKQGSSPQPNTWTTEPVPEYTGPSDDQELISRALNSKSGAGAVFGGRASFADLWNKNEAAFAIAYPDDHGNRPYNSSEVDAALAQHLAFWTGKNCERIRRLLFLSALRRDKWDRDDYLVRTILRAVGLQQTVYSIAATSDVTGLRGSEIQITWAAQLRAAAIAAVPSAEQIFLAQDSAKWWIDLRDRTPEQLAQMLTPITSATARPTDGPEYTVGYQVLGPEQQVDHFRGCVYVVDANKIFVPDGQLVNKEQFNAIYGGYEYPISSNGKRKPTTKAFEAFTESQLVKYPIAESICFQPNRIPGEIVNRDGRTLVNVYVPAITERRKGDATRFYDLLGKLLPNSDDRTIALSYLAACVQYKGTKFQWAPLFQGTEGNGKSFITDSVAAAIGERYVHMPPATEIGEKFNDWLFERLLIGVEDIYIPEQKRELIEILNPMIPARRYPCRAMQQSQKMRDMCANFIFNSNHKDAVRKTENDRRLAIFYTAQQKAEHLGRDGMTGDYFPTLYNWARAEGFAIIHDVLATYQIPDQLNPAAGMHRAPRTSSTGDAIQASLGSVEQQILEAVDEGRPGFAGGWISSHAVDTLLKSMRRDNSIPLNKRRELLQDLGYDYHPALRGGRVNNAVMPDGGKPRLFVKRGHLALNITSPAEVAAAYQRAQGAIVGSQTAAGAVFGGR